MTFLLFGANGMLGRTVYAYLKSKGYEVIPLCRKDYEVSSLDLDRLEALFDKHEIKEGDWVNLEFDILGKYVARLMQSQGFDR